MDERKLIDEHSERMTKVMRQTLNCICSFQFKNGMPPTYREIQEAMGWRTTSAPYLYVQKLVNMGYLEVTPWVSRGIRILRDPNDSETPPAGMRQYIAEVLRGKRRLPMNVRIEQADNEISLIWPDNGPRHTVRIEEGVDDKISV
jgi:SOS-response transcriptional repressor LexA